MIKHIKKNFIFADDKKNYMKFTAQINIMPLNNLLDPQGKAVKQTLHSLKYSEISDVRIGKHIKIVIDANDEQSAKQIAEEISRKVLANPVMEYFKINVSKLDL